MHMYRKGATGALSTLLWTARALSVVSVLMLLLFLSGEDGLDSSKVRPHEWAGLLFFPFGVIAGMFVAWWRERLGGAVCVGSLLAFYVWQLLVAGGLPRGPYFLAFTLPGFLFLLYGLLSRRSHNLRLTAG